MMFVTTVRYRIRLARGDSDVISPSRGLRQGDPLSPYLFLICAEGLSTLLNYESERGNLHGCVVSVRAPAITHLFFADDSFLFFRATDGETECIKECLSRYEDASGQVINYEKSSIVYSRNVEQGVRDNIFDILHVHATQNHGMYLGAPSLIGRNKTDVFDYVKDKVRRRFTSWKFKDFSKAGKETLLKSVIQAIPGYIMGVFLLPAGICGDLEMSMNKFFWNNGRTTGRGINWLNWNNLCRRKEVGGLGFRKLHLFNKAMLAKQCWRIVNNPNSLLAQIYKAKYHPDKEFLDADLGNNPSFSWRSIFSAREVIKNTAVKRVGSGSSIRIYHDPWLLDTTNPYIESVGVDGLQNATVSMLIGDNTHSWNYVTVTDLFNARDAEQILKIPLPRTDVEDRWSWPLTKDGDYSVKSGYRKMVTEELTVNNINNMYNLNWQGMWRLDIPSKVKHHLWRIFSESLPTAIKLRSRKVEVTEICAVCNNDEESAFHILVACNFAKKVWERSQLGDASTRHSNIYTWWIAWKSEKQREEAAMVLWSIWFSRNQKVWKNKKLSIEKTYTIATETLEAWRKAKVKINSNVEKGSTEDLRWHKPAEGWRKCNVDASQSSELQMHGCGAVLRADNGEFVAALATRFTGNHSAEMIEAISVREALSWLKDRGENKVIVETDSSILYHAITNKEDNASTFNLVVRDCINLLHDIDHSQISLVRRSANSAAHSLSRVALSYTDRLVWEGVPPAMICNVLEHDLI